MHLHIGISFCPVERTSATSRALVLRTVAPVAAHEGGDPLQRAHGGGEGDALKFAGEAHQPFDRRSSGACRACC